MEPVLILGAGINGCALARELAINGVPVWIVDSHDIAFGATSRSSRLIHGGLRYLEHAEFDLVRESLAERGRLLRLAPQFVKPLQLFIPSKRRSGGIFFSGMRFFKMSPPGFLGRSRGSWLVRMGLWMYDAFAKDKSLPKHRSHVVGDKVVPEFDPASYRWAASYFDAQIRYPERFCLALLEDARRASVEHGIELRAFTKVQTSRINGKFIIAKKDRSAVWELQPSAIVNATGAWGDVTLQAIKVESQPMFAGTKGSHFVTRNVDLKRALAGQSVYAEADDGRLVFVLEYGDGILVGTTDERFQANPAFAIATKEEIIYLCSLVNQLFPQVKLGAEDIEYHYCGVRPLPVSNKATTAAVTRRHWIAQSKVDDKPLLTLIGGKLTTCRAFAELAANAIFTALNLTRSASTRNRLIPGAENHPADDEAMQAILHGLATKYDIEVKSVAAIWTLLGTRVEEVLAKISLQGSNREYLDQTPYPMGFVRWVIANESAVSIGDLVERRLMLLDQNPLTKKALVQLGHALGEGDQELAFQVETDVEEAIQSLKVTYGKKVID